MSLNALQTLSMAAFLGASPLCFAATELKGDVGLAPLAAGCGCHSAADCTCKKGSCKCAKCGGHHQKLMESLNTGKADVQLPETARRDASAGVFI